MITLEELRRRKKEMHLTNQEIADLSGLPLGTAQKVLAGITRSPRCDTLEALEKVADGRSTKIIVPSDIQGLAGLVASVKEVAAMPEDTIEK